MNQQIKTFLISIALIISSGYVYSQEAIKIKDSKISTIIIYNGWAEIKRTFELEVPLNKTKIEITIPSANIDLHRLLLTSNSNFVKCVSIYGDIEMSLSNAEPKSDEKEISNLYKQVKSLEAEILSLQNALEMLEKLKKNLLENIASDSSAEKLNTESWNDSLNQLKNKAFEITQKTREIEVKKWNLNKEIDNKKAKGNINYPMQKISEDLKISIQLESTQKAKAVFELTYFIKGPAWRPEYDMRYDEKTQKLNFKYYAKIKQETGEDWSQVNVVISTSNLDEAIALPTLPKKFLELNEQIVKAPHLSINKEKAGEIIVKDESVAVIQKKVLFNDIEKENKEVVENEDQNFETELKDNGLKTKFQLNNITVSSTKENQRFTILDKDIDFNIRLEIAPSEWKEAYRRLSFKNNFGQVILPGALNLYLNGRPIGKVQIPMVIAGSETSIPFGSVQGLYGEKEVLLLDKKETKLETTKYRIIKYQLNLKNYDSKPVTFRLYETIPISKMKDIFIQFDETALGFTTQIPGLIYQDITLKPNEKKVIKIQYTMESKGDFTF